MKFMCVRTKHLTQPQILDSTDLLAFDLDGYKILIRFLEKKGQTPNFIDLSHPVRAARFG